jgi:hypothetical protein
VHFRKKKTENEKKKIKKKIPAIGLFQGAAHEGGAAGVRYSIPH